MTHLGVSCGRRRAGTWRRLWTTGAVFGARSGCRATGFVWVGCQTWLLGLLAWIAGCRFEERRAAVQAACRALTGIEGELWAAGGADLGQFMSQLDELARCGSMRRGWRCCARRSTGVRPGGPLGCARVAAGPLAVAAGRRVGAGGAAGRDRPRRPVCRAAGGGPRGAGAAGHRGGGGRGVRAARASPGRRGRRVRCWPGWSTSRRGGGPRTCRGIRDRLVAKYGRDRVSSRPSRTGSCEQRSLSQPFADGSRPVRVHDGRRRRGQGDDRGRRAGTVGAATGRR